MEPYLCNVVSIGRIAAQLFDDEDQGLFIFATSHLDDMLRELRARKISRGSDGKTPDNGAGSGPRLHNPRLTRAVHYRNVK
jgi:hypothetical protein